MLNPVEIKVSSQPDCPEAELFKSHTEGEIGAQDYTIAMAVQDGNRCQGVMPRSYAPMPKATRDYCMNRTQGTMPYDFEMAKRLGDWFRGVYSASFWNQERLEHFAWAAEKTKGIQAGDAHANLCRARDRFAGHVTPIQDIKLCLWVKRLDSEMRERTTRGGRASS